MNHAASQRMEQVSTGVSAAYWHDEQQPEKFVPATMRIAHPETGQTAWLDELFLGGIKIPEVGSRSALTVLLTGPPGIGKSTLALELCYRLAVRHKLESHYFSTEGHAPWLVQHAREFGWDLGQSSIGETSEYPVRVSSIRSKDDFEQLEFSLNREKGLLASLRTILPNLDDRAQDLDASEEKSRDIAVIDNLNTATVEDSRWFQAIAKLSEVGTRLIIVVFDSTRGNKVGRQWEYLADTVIRLERAQPKGYLIRTIEVVKSRYQKSVSGPHQFKILDRSSVPREGPNGRKHPYRREGGVFIFPSMHFLLSRYNDMTIRERRPGSRARLETPYPDLTLLLQDGFPVGKCTALIGSRGTHKSRLAFAQLLYTLHNDPTARGLIISLGNDEQGTIGNLQRIQNQEESLRGAQDVEGSLVIKGRLEVSYYPPGFITADEFFHRLQLSISRLQASATGPVLLVFDSLELMASQFPLCAEHSVFVPAMVEILTTLGVTSFFVAPSADKDDHGLLSVADPILRFSRRNAEESELSARSAWWPIRFGTTDGMRTVVTARVERFAAGTSAGEEVELVLLPDSAGGVRGLQVVGQPASAQAGH